MNPIEKLEALRDEQWRKYEDAEGCCSGFECGCMGLPIDPDAHLAKQFGDALDAILSEFEWVDAGEHTVSDTFGAPGPDAEISVAFDGEDVGSTYGVLLYKGKGES